MRRHWEYLKYVVRHKRFVFQACRKMRVSLLTAIAHDWDKFLPSMWLAYARTFYALDGTKQYVSSDAFTHAWNSHQKRNKHHWQFWLITYDRGETEALKMPEKYVREMIADWMGAGAALGKPDTVAWYLKEYKNIKLHPATRVRVDELLGVIPSVHHG